MKQRITGKTSSFLTAYGPFPEKETPAIPPSMRAKIAKRAKQILKPAPAPTKAPPKMVTRKCETTVQVPGRAPKTRSMQSTSVFHSDA